MPSVYDFSARSLAGDEVPLKRFEGKVLLIVNTASACGFTPQYQGLEVLHRELSPRGFCVLGFPCNQFGGQEPGSAEEIAEFCSATYGATFPMTEKVEVNGPGRHPLYDVLTAAADDEGRDGDVQWNFEKFLVDADGSVVARFAPRVEPGDERLRKQVESLLKD
jgi:glutathione peroxidase